MKFVLQQLEKKFNMHRTHTTGFEFGHIVAGKL